MKSQEIVCFGELLWDLFPSGKKVGGAPFNVASSLNSLGAEVHFVSRVGVDPLGVEILEEVKSQGVSTELIQHDSSHETGKVLVHLDEKGVANYEIASDAAWDFIEVQSEAQEKVSQAAAFVYGSLVARANSLKTLKSFLKVAPFRVFDVNLRPPHYNLDILMDLILQADLLKFNDEELYLLAELLGSPFHSMDQHIAFIAQKTNTPIVCVTKGKFGAVLYHRDSWFYNSGFKIRVKDTVGAGDSFLATLVNGLIKAIPLQLALDNACAMGALVAGSDGANPIITEKDLRRFIRKD